MVAISTKIEIPAGEKVEVTIDSIVGYNWVFAVVVEDKGFKQGSFSGSHDVVVKLDSGEDAIVQPTAIKNWRRFEVPASDLDARLIELLSQGKKWAATALKNYGHIKDPRDRVNALRHNMTNYDLWLRKAKDDYERLTAFIKANEQIARELPELSDMVLHQIALRRIKWGQNAR